MGYGLQAQVIEDSDPPVMDEEVEDEADVRIVDPRNARLSEAEETYEDALKQLQKAQKDVEKAREDKMNAENGVESARVDVRRAQIAMNEQKKQMNPIVIERYEVNINPIYEEMSKGMTRGLSTYLEGSEKDGLFNVFSKNVDSEFKAYMKQFKSSKIKKQKGELFFDNILIPEMSASTMDLYVDFVKEGNGVSMRTYFDKGGEFVDFDRDNAIVRYAERMMDSFARYMRTNNLEDEIESLEKDLKKTQDDMKDNRKDISKAKEDIQKLEAEIAEKRNKVGEYDTAVDSINDKLELTRKKLSKVN